MKKEDYKRISLENLAKQVHVNFIMETKGLIISRNPTTEKDFGFDFSFPYILEGILFILCTGGKAKTKINLTEYDLSEERILVASPNHIIQLTDQSDDFRIEFLFFNFDFVSGMEIAMELGNVAQLVAQQPFLKPDKETFAELLGLHSLMAKQHEKTRRYRDHLTRNLFYSFTYIILQLYSELERIDSDKKMSRQESIHTRFISLLFENYKAERTLGFYAEKLHLTPKYLSKTIKEFNDIPATEWIDEMVIMGAKALLKSSEYTVAQISEELNFANSSFFGTFFKKKTGMTPLQYRFYNG